MSITSFYFNAHWMDHLAPIQKSTHNEMYNREQVVAVWRSAEEAFDTALDFINANLEPNHVLYFEWCKNSGFPEKYTSFYVSIEDADDERGYKTAQIRIPDVKVIEREGCVYDKKDISYHDDIDATYSVRYWNPDTNDMESEPVVVGHGIGTSVSIDIKPEYIATYLMQQYEKATRDNFRNARQSYKHPPAEKGTRIKLAKDYKPRKGEPVPAGTEGIIFWFGPSKFGNGTVYGINIVKDGEVTDETIWRNSHHFDTLPDVDDEWKPLDELTAAHEAAWNKYGIKIAEIDERIKMGYDFCSSSYGFAQRIIHRAYIKKRAEERKAIAERMTEKPALPRARRRE